jgi:hypothetical protein
MDQDCASARGLASFVLDRGQEILRGKPSGDFTWARDGAADDVGRFSSLSLVFLPQIFLKRRLGILGHVGGCELVDRPGL